MLFHQTYFPGTTKLGSSGKMAPRRSLTGKKRSNQVEVEDDFYGQDLDSSTFYVKTSILRPLGIWQGHCFDNHVFLPTVSCFLLGPQKVVKAPNSNDSTYVSRLGTDAVSTLKHRGFQNHVFYFSSRLHLLHWEMRPPPPPPPQVLCQDNCQAFFLENLLSETQG
jgi:hypothetical protein